MVWKEVFRCGKREWKRGLLRRKLIFSTSFLGSWGILVSLTKRAVRHRRQLLQRKLTRPSCGPRQKRRGDLAPQQISHLPYLVWRRKDRFFDLAEAWCVPDICIVSSFLARSDQAKNCACTAVLSSRDRGLSCPVHSSCKRVFASLP